MDTLISIIIPVYNVEKYLRRCLDSVIAQTYTNWECLLIDDGSKDSSGSICDEYSAKDTRFRVFHKENGGVSSARNTGIDNCIGEFVYFSDSDDELFPNCIETLYCKIGDSYDSVMAGYEKIEDGNVIVSPEMCKDEERSQQESLIDFYISRHGVSGAYLWNRLFRLAIIRKHNIYFNTDIYCKEDGLFVVSYLCSCSRKYIVTYTPVYRYYSRPSGAWNHMISNDIGKYVTNLDARFLIYKCVESSYCYNEELEKIYKKNVEKFSYTLFLNVFENNISPNIVIRKSLKYLGFFKTSVNLLKAVSRLIAK